MKTTNKNQFVRATLRGCPLPGGLAKYGIGHPHRGAPTEMDWDSDRHTAHPPNAINWPHIGPASYGKRHDWGFEYLYG